MGADAEQPMPTWEQLHMAVALVCEEKGWHHGVPIPSSANMRAKIVMAKGCPLSEGRDNIPVQIMDDETDIIPEDVLVNSWTTQQIRTCIIRDEIGTFKVRIPQAELKLRIHLDSAMLRVGALTARAELKAMETLFRNISKMQRESYVLNGMFPETSNRSGVSYIFRKGLPTLAMRLTKIDEKRERRHFLAALCLHPLAYYADSFAGCTPPTDEVLTHLLLMRTDEHRYWKKSGQHPLEDWRSGI
jgi:hypothetical protein